MRYLDHLPVLLLAASLAAGACGDEVSAYRTTEQLIRPTEGEGFIGNGYGDVPVSSFASEGGNFRVWWAEEGEHRPPTLDESPQNGVPDYAEKVADAADRVSEQMLELGFRLPLPDDEYNDGGDYGGDDRFDIYLVNTHGGDGYSVSEGCVNFGVLRCSGYLAIENDFYGYGYPSIDEAIEILVSHEYVHAVQNAYNANIPSWWSEGTATWFEEYFNSDQDDFERLASTYFREPGRSLNSRTRGPTDVYAYGTSLFVYFIAETLDAEVVPGIFGRSAAGEELERYIDEELSDWGVTLAEAFQQFSIWNLFTGTRAINDAGYPVAGDLPTMSLTGLDGSQSLNWDQELTSLAASYARLTFDSAITLELKQIDGWGNTLDAAFTDTAAFADSETFSVLDLSGPVRLEADESPVLIVLTNGYYEDRAAARLAVRIARDEPEPEPEPELEPQPEQPPLQEVTSGDEGCAVAGDGRSTPAGFLLMLGAAVIGLRRRHRAETHLEQSRRGAK